MYPSSLFARSQSCTAASSGGVTCGVFDGAAGISSSPWGGDEGAGGGGAWTGETGGSKRAADDGTCPASGSKRARIAPSALEQLDGLAIHGDDAMSDDGT